jgi:predicted cupin superfamily sugar epimerase
MLSADDVIRLLNLKPHEMEGGFYRETYRSADQFPRTALPPRYPGDRSASTAIYYLLTPETFSTMHRVATDEVFHFYLGDPVTMLQLWPDGGKTLTLGTDLTAGQQPQLVVPHGIWQGSLLQPGGRFALMGATVAPGFDFKDYEAGDRRTLTAQYPAFAELIARLTHE